MTANVLPRFYESQCIYLYSTQSQHGNKVTFAVCGRPA